MMLPQSFSTHVHRLAQSDEFQFASEFAHPDAISPDPQIIHVGDKLKRILPRQDIAAQLIFILLAGNKQGKAIALVASRNGSLAPWLGQQAELNSTTHLHNLSGETRSVDSFFDRKSPVGEIDGSAVVLLQYSLEQGMRPLAMGSFWWGEAPGDVVRHHGYYYPVGRGRMKPMIEFLLKGLAVASAPKLVCEFSPEFPPVIYEDADILAVDKPSGMLSVPGKIIEDCVFSRLKKRFPLSNGPLLLHRLDLSTSGVLLVAKNAEAHRALQKQFVLRRVNKRYQALLLSGEKKIADNGSIDLPLRVDFDDRPRQMVCHRHGKPALTHWEVISRHDEQTRVYFYPQTGRTHQLRVHASHVAGLNAPIVGDELYGIADGRLKLHAQSLAFLHPISGKEITIESEPPF